MKKGADFRRAPGLSLSTKIVLSQPMQRRLQHELLSLLR